jgi:hypothetical protein
MSIAVNVYLPQQKVRKADAGVKRATAAAPYQGNSTLADPPSSDGGCDAGYSRHGGDDDLSCGEKGSNVGDFFLIRGLGFECFGPAPPLTGEERMW